MDKNNCLKIEKECLSCGVCVKNCVMLKEYVSDPKQFFSSFSSGSKTDAIIPYSCFICGYCSTICPKQLNLGDGFMEIRNSMVLENNKKIPVKALGSVDIHQRLSFSKIFTT